MNTENVKVEETVETVTEVAKEATKVAGPFIEQKSSKAAWVVGGGVLLTIIAGVTVGVTKRIKSKKNAMIETAPDDADIDEMIDTDIESED